MLVPAAGGATGLAAAAGQVCYLEPGELALRCVRATGGAAVTIATGVGAFAMDGTNVYYATASSSATTLRPLRRTPVGGGGTTVVSADEPSVGGLAVDATHVYWLRVGAAGETSVCMLPK
jgi:sugar lactone lactonase YvrE